MYQRSARNFVILFFPLYCFMVLSDVAEPFEHLGLGISSVFFIILRPPKPRASRIPGLWVGGLVLQGPFLRRPVPEHTVPWGQRLSVWKGPCFEELGFLFFPKTIP